MNSSLWLLSLLGFALLNQGWCRPQLEDESNYPNDGDGDDYDNGDDDAAEESGPPPSIVSTPVILTLKTGDVALFPCVVDGVESSITRVWRKDSKGLYVGSIKSHNNSRVTLLPDNSLEVRDVTPEDAGTYKCMVARTSDTQEVEHTLNIKGPAKITKITPQENAVTVKKHATLTLECYAQGFPAPSTKWSKDGSALKGDEDPSEEGARLVIYEVTPDNAGEYKCSTSNEGQAVPDERTVMVQVSSPPEIEIENAVVSTGEGYESELTCVLHGQKKSELKWYRVGKAKQLIGHSSRVRLEEKGNKHTLRILKTQASDFGDYSCEAKNSEGQASVTITLTGNPSTPLLETSENEEGTNNPVLVYKIESFAPIEEYELLYKKDSTDDWQTLKPTVTPATEGKVFSLKHKFGELEPGNYEVKIRAKNSNGWSNFSSTYQFPQEHKQDQTETGPLAVSAGESVGPELRISLSLLFSLVVARFFC